MLSLRRQRIAAIEYSVAIVRTEGTLRFTFKLDRHDLLNELLPPTTACFQDYSITRLEVL